MTARIIDRGRGPEIEGTRITINRIMDSLRYPCSSDEIVRELNLTAEQVQAALEYIEAHRAEVEAVHRQSLERVARGNPAWVEKLLAPSLEELKQRILARRRNGDSSQCGG